MSRHDFYLLLAFVPAALLLAAEALLLWRRSRRCRPLPRAARR